MDARSDAPKIGKMIKRARERKRMSQAEAAEALGVSRSALNAWENDRAYPRSSIGALEELYGITIDGEPERPAEPEMPAPAELERLRQHIREVLGDEAAPFIRMMDEALGGKPPSGPRRGAAPGRAESGRARWPGSEQLRKRLS